MMRYMIIAAGLALVLISGTPLHAQTSSAAPDLPDVKEDQELLDSISEIGLIGGHAIQCDPKNEALGTQALKVGDRISDDFGPHEAYLFMVYFGIGSTEQIDAGNCGKIKKSWEDFIAEEKIEE